MRITPLGGTDIGASCLALEIEGHLWVIDAGVRYQEQDPLPAFAWLEEQGQSVEAIFITHAHQDHTGSLPFLSRLHPDAPVFMTRPTADILRVMLQDALQLSEQGFGPRLFSAEDLDRLWDRIRILGQDRALTWQGIRVSAYTAGHILGAVSLGFESGREGSLLITGDVSVRPTRLLPGGLRFPRGTSFDTVVTEATYGSRLHLPRSEQERRLVETVAGVIAGGGSVLIPAFAVGRAQEILLLLQETQARNPQVPRFPLLADGLVRAVNPIHGAYPHLLSGPLRRRLHTTGHLLDPEVVRPVRSARERSEVLSGRPACIVSSSGMLSGGPSVFYAAAMAEDPRHAILLSGYQDEESPGRHLQTLLETPPTQRLWLLGDRTLRPAAQIASFGLSAHADREELLTAILPLRPRQVVVLHGDPQSRETLAAAFRERGVAAAVPGVGETVAVAGEERRVPLPRREEPVDRRTWRGQVLLIELSEPEGWLLGVARRQTPETVEVEDADGRLRPVPPAAVLLAVGPVPPGEEAAIFLRQVWTAAQDCLAQGRTVGRGPAQRIAAALAERGAFAPSAVEVARLLDPHGFRKVKTEAEGRLVTAFCAFPWAVPVEKQQELATTLQHIGWRFALAQEPYLPAVEGALRDLLHAAGRSADRVLSPRSYPLERRILVPLQTGSLPQPQEVRAWEDALCALAGGTVQLEIRVAEAASAAPAPRSRWEQNAAIGRMRTSALPDWGIERIAVHPAEGRLEVVAAFPDRLQQDPEFTAWQEAMAGETGWGITLSPRVNQAALTARARTLVPVRSEPSLHLPRRTVRVSLREPMSQDEWEKVAAAFREDTGWRLEQDTPLPAARRTAPLTGARMDATAAMNHLRRRAEEAGLWVHRVSLQGDTLLLRCTTPEVAVPFAEAIARWSTETGWSVAVADAVHQQALLDLAVSLVGRSSLLRTPGIRAEHRQVVVRCLCPLSEEQQQRFREATGWELITE